jgi:RNA polymerase sigma-70 factor (ECF subfamily)
MNAKDLFEILVREHAPMLTAYLRCLVRSQSQVDDLFQETMLTAWRNLDKFDRSKPFGPWLRGIAANLSMAARRKGSREFRLLEPAMLEHLEGRFQELQRQPGDNLDEQLECLRDCLSRLPEPYRETIRLRYSEEIKGEALASRLNASIESVKKRLQRARERLLTCLRQKLSLGGTGA